MMSVTMSNYPFASNGWCNGTSPMRLMPSSSSSSSESNGNIGNVDDGLTSLSWLQNLNMCMTRLGAPTPPTPPASPNNNSYAGSGNICGTLMSTSSMETTQCPIIPKFHSFHNHREKSYHNGHNSYSKKSQPTEEDPIDYKTNGEMKPPYSYATLICMAMKANKNKMTLSAIYKWIRENFMYYRNADPSWQNSIRHNLSLNKCFIKIPRNKDEPGKGGFWRLDPVYADTLVDGVFKKRRTAHRNVSGNTKNKAVPFKKKSRKKDNLSPLASVGGKNLISNGIETTQMLHDTPPNSAESYNPYGEPTSEVVELATAVSSIESVSHCPTYTYTLHGSHHDQHMTHHGYVDEVCIATAPSDACMLSADGNDICWNAILTDSDLELVDPSNYAGAVVESVESSPNGSETTTTTAQLTAVEPHSLHLVAAASSATNGIEEAELFQNGVTRQLNHITINHNTNVVSDIISATHNVVTCVNPTSVSTGDWSHWTAFPVLSNHDNQNATTDLMIRQINVNADIISNGNVHPSISFVTPNTNNRPQNDINHSNGHHNNITQPASPSSSNYDHQNTLQPWSECKAALEAAALDLETFGDLENVHTY